MYAFDTIESFEGWKRVQNRDGQWKWTGEFLLSDEGKSKYFCDYPGADEIPEGFDYDYLILTEFVREGGMLHGANGSFSKGDLDLFRTVIEGAPPAVTNEATDILARFQGEQQLRLEL